MSGRIVPRIMLAGLLAVIFTGAAAAQDVGFVPPISGVFVPAQTQKALPVAPMPQVKKQYHVEIELSVGLPNVIELKYICDEVVSSIPHETTSQPPACCLKQTASAVPVMPQPRRPDLKNYGQYSIGLGVGMEPPVLPQAQYVSPPTCPGTARANPWVLTPPAAIMPPAAMYPVPGSFTESCQRTMSPMPPQFLMAPPVLPAPPMQGTIVGGFGSCPPPPMVIRMAPPMPPAGPIVVIRQFKTDFEMSPANVCTWCTLASATPNPLIGTWHRKIGRCSAVITFTHDEMKMCLTRTEDEQKLVVTVTAQYTLTKEGLVYGVITGADMEDPEGGKMGKDNLDGELDDIVLDLQSFIDHPFSFRMKMTSAGLMVSNVKVAAPEKADPEEFVLFGGLYKQAKNGSLSCPLTAKTTNCGVAGCVLSLTGKPQLGAAIGGLAGTAGAALIGSAADKDLLVVPQPPMGQPLPPGGYSFPLPLNVAPPTMAQPACPPMPQPVRPVSGCGFPNEPMKQMAADAFDLLLQQNDAKRTGGMTLPTPRYVKHYPPCVPPPLNPEQYLKHTQAYDLHYPQYVSPNAILPMPRELASMEDPNCPMCPAGAKRGPVGTWYRDLGNRRCVLNIAGDHMTITVSEAYEENGKTVTGNLTFTADYHLTRDGVTAVGLITSVDMKFEGDLDEDEAKQMYDQLGEIQKKLEDEPIAMSLRMYGDSLVIGKVRIPSVEKMDTQPATYVAGRFTRVGDKPMPKLKAVKMLPVPVPPGFDYGMPVLPAYGPPVPPYGPVPGAYGSPVPVMPSASGVVAPGYSAVPVSEGLLPAPGVPAQGYVPPPPAYAPDPVGENLPPQGLPPRPCPAPLARPMTCPTPNPQAFVPSPPLLPVSEDAPEMTAPPPRPTPQMPQPIQPGVSSNGPIQVTPLDPQCLGALIGACTGRPILGEAVAAKPHIQGTWYRELGPMLCVLKIDADHITLTGYMVGRLEDGTEAKEGMVITADYHVSRNGTSVIGQITSVDLFLEGDIPESGDLTGELRDLHKTLVDQLFSASFRLYGDTLVLGALRIPGLGDKMSEGQMLMLGRYKNLGDKPLPKPKPLKEKRVGRGEYSAPLPPAPKLDVNGAVIQPGYEPAPTQPGTYGGQPVPIQPGSIEYALPPSANPAVSPATVPSMPEPTPPAMQMPEPTPPTLGQLKPAMEEPLTSANPTLRITVPPLGPAATSECAGSFLQTLQQHKPASPMFYFGSSFGLFGSQ